jgi:demethylmenaquinone methyltransferase / 2-methoxy-6-polyprenyl-1,4-benzoquinol methylase
MKPHMNDKKTTDFGFQQIPSDKKSSLVSDVFSSVASKYDIMNDLMSCGVHRIWKRQAIKKLNPKPGHHVLDLAGGTGDITRLLSERVGPAGQVTLADINEDMLRAGRDKLLDKGLCQHIHFVQANAELLPFPDNHFDAVTIAFGLRNVTDKDAALRAMQRVLKPGGCLLILEFSTPTIPLLNKCYDRYSFSLLPKIGQWVTGDKESYQYLVESIRMHPDQKTLAAMMKDAAFDRVTYDNLSAGIVAIHRGYKDGL